MYHSSVTVGNSIKKDRSAGINRTHAEQRMSGRYATGRGALKNA